MTWRLNVIGAHCFSHSLHWQVCLFSSISGLNVAKRITNICNLREKAIVVFQVLRSGLVEQHKKCILGRFLIKSQSNGI